MTRPRTAIAPAPSNARHSSARDRAAARPGSAMSTGSAPAPAPASGRNVRLPLSPRCSLGACRLGIVIRLLGAVILFPEALFLQRIGHFFRHVVLVMLGEHGIGLEHA